MYRLAGIVIVCMVASTGHSLADPVKARQPLTRGSSFVDLMESLGSSSPAGELAKVRPDSKVTFVHIPQMPGYSRSAMHLTPAARKAVIATEASVDLSTTLLGRLIDAGYLTTDVMALAVDEHADVVVFLAK